MAKQTIKGIGEQVGEIVKDTVKTASQEPKKILENILGQKSDDGEKGVELPGSGGKKKTKAKQQQSSDQLLVNKKLEEEKKRAALLQYHREQMREEEAFSVEDEQKEQQEESKEEEEKQKQVEIVQLKRQKEKDAALQAESTTQKGPVGPLGAKMKKKKGTREMGKQIT